MRQKLKKTLLACTLLVAATPAWAEESTVQDRKDLALTVYNDNLGLVREVRTIRLEKGQRELQYADVAAGIDPTTVSLRSLSAPSDLKVLEQNYEYDLLTPEKLLEKYIGKDVEIHADTTVNKATLLSTNDGQIYRIGDKIYLQPPGRVVLPQVPANLVARPTLKWLLQNDRATGEQQTETSYLTRGLSWRTDYVLVVGQDQVKSALNGWVTLDNQSGASYDNARLTLVAGDVNRVRPQGAAMDEGMRMMKSVAQEEQFAERALFEYHSYQLNRPTTLKDRQTKQVSLLSAAEIPTRKVYRFEAPSPPIWIQTRDRSSQKVSVYLELTNSKQDKLGMPLPKGIVRIYQQDADKRLQFVGEDRIDHTPRDERLRFKAGQAFDLVGERKQTSYKVLGDRLIESSYEIELRNRKDQPVTILATEKLGGDWDITQASLGYSKLDANTVEFAVQVPANKTAKVTYTVRTKY